MFTWSGGPRSSGVGFFCFDALGDTKQKKLTPLDLACVAGVRKGRGREFGRETTREGGGRGGNACKEAIVFAIPPTN